MCSFPPELWPEVRALIEQKCGHIEEEVRHPSCNWSLVRFGNPGDAEEALKWNDQAVLEGVWVYVTRLTQAVGWNQVTLTLISSTASPLSVLPHHCPRHPHPRDTRLS
eukprot:Blabericola_migrator_1__2911@NODE_1837_length_3709_cov_113_312740_g519_i1_p3_GENE_NODE_1837_length_3709_cov_113_312740_g519_i1NODE_1837_length_3709_cov_113_312740_g519_i1_p3_ORF_typecomplete_len108_score10_63Nup35_RRM/PF05172_13/5_1e05Nup35_RRM_2/PF14605_6/0_039_NODE_1837_length_3709_cov_113_312740_g519_i1153476